MISFEMPESISKTTVMMQSVAENMMRPVSRRFDEEEHEIPWDYINFMHEAMKAMGAGSLRPDGDGRKEGPRLGYQRLAVMIECLSWGDAGLYLCTPGGGLGAAAVEATGTPEQKARFLKRFSGDKPIVAGMAMTEPQAGSDTAAIRTTAVRDGEEWVLNGEKIFVTAGHKSLVDTPGFVVVWATIDPAAGRAGMRPFVVEAGTPGCSVTNLEREVIEMEVMLRSAWLLVLKAVWLADEHKPNTLEASMSKVKAGDVVTKITQRAVELMGPLGYSRDLLLEKWFRDAKINDIFEGTGQINRLIVARRILNYSSKELR